MTRILGLTWVELALIIIGAAALSVEVAALVAGDPLISPTMRNDGRRWIVWPLLWGVLGGHFFGPSFAHPTWTVYPLIGAGVLALARDLFLASWLPVGALWPVFVLGILLGAGLWGQR